MKQIKMMLALLAALVCGGAWAAVPVAIWDGGFNTLTKGDYTLNLNGNTKATNNSTVTITGSNGGIYITGAPIYTVLVKAKGYAPSTSDKNEVLISMLNSSNTEYVGAGARSDSYQYGIWNGAQWVDRAGTIKKSAATSFADSNDGNSHTYALTYSYRNEAEARNGTAFYYDGEQVTYFDGLAASGFTVSTGVVIGGRRQSSTTSLADATNMVIEGIAIFGNDATKEDLKNFVWPKSRTDELGKSPAGWLEFERNLELSGANQDFFSSWPSSDEGRYSYVNSDAGLAYGVIDGQGCHPYGSITSGRMESSYTVVSRVRSIARDTAVFWALGHSTAYGNQALGLISRGANKVALFESSGSTVNKLFDNVEVPNASMEYHDYAVTVDGNSVEFFVDGVSKGTTTKTYTPSANLQIGSIMGGVGTASTPAFKRTTGISVDDWRFYSEVLTAEQIKTIADSRVKRYAYPEVIAMNFNAKAYNNGSSDGGDTHNFGADEWSIGAMVAGMPGSEWNTDTQTGWGSRTTRTIAAGNVKVYNFAKANTKTLNNTTIEYSANNTFKYQDAYAKQLRGYLDDGASNGYGAQVTIANIPYKKYDVAIYSATDTANKHFFPIEVNNTKYIGSAKPSVVCQSNNDSRWGWSQSKSCEFGRNATKVEGLSGTLSVKALPGNSGSGYRGGIAAVEVAPHNHVIIDSENEEITWPASLISGTAYIYARANGTVSIPASPSISLTSLVVYGTGNVTINIANGQTISAIDASELTGTLTLDVAGSIKPTLTVSGALVKRGSGTLELTTSATPSEIVVEAGILKQPENASNWAFGSSSAQRTITVKSGAQLDLNGCYSTPINYVIAGNGPDGTGAIKKPNANGNSNQVCCGSVFSLTDDATINVAGRWCLIAPSHGNHAINLNNHKLTKIGSADLVFDAVTVNGGGDNGELIIKEGALKANAWLGEGGGGHFWDDIDCTLTIKSTGDLTVNSSMPVKNLNLEKAIAIGSGINIRGKLTMTSAFTGNGTLTVHDNTTFGFPTGTEEDSSFSLGGSLLIVDNAMVAHKTVTVGEETKEDVTLIYSTSDKSVKYVTGLLDTYTMTSEEVAAIDDTQITENGYCTVTISQPIQPHSTINGLPAGYSAIVPGGANVKIVKHHSNSVSIKTGRRSDTDGNISLTNSAGSHEVPGVLWNYTYTTSQNDADNGYYNDVLQPIDGTGALSPMKFAFYAVNTYFTQNGDNKNANGNSQMTYTYIDDGSVAAATQWTAVDKEYLLPSVTMPTPQNARGWQLHISDIPYKMYDLYIYVASDQGTLDNNTLKACSMSLSVDGGTTWKWYAGDPDHHATIAAASSNTWKADPYSTGTLTEGTNFIKIRVSKAMFGQDNLSTIDICHGARNTGSNIRSGLAAIQIVEVADDGIYNRIADTEGKDWTATDSWTRSDGEFGEWPTSAEMVLANIDADQTSSITVNDIITANNVTISNTGDNGSFAFLTKEDLSTVNDTTVENPPYILKSPVDVMNFSGDLYLQSRIQGRISLGANTTVTFVAGEEGQDTEANRAIEATAFPYEFAGSNNPIKKVGYGTFIVPSSMYDRAFSFNEGKLRYTDEGNVSGNLSGSGELVFAPGENKVIMISGNNTSFTGTITVESGTLKLGSGNCLGRKNDSSRTIVVKRGATLDMGGQGSSTDVAYTIKLEEGAKYTNSVAANTDSKWAFLPSGLELLGDATIHADTARVGLSRGYNYETTINLGSYTLTKTGSGEAFFSRPTISGTGKFKVEAGNIRMACDNDNAQPSFAEGTLELCVGTQLNFDNYSNGVNIPIKNVILNGSVTAGGSNGRVTVNNELSGSGSVYQLTLADNATVDCTGEGAITVSGNVTFGANVTITNAQAGDTVFALAENTTVTYPTTVTVGGSTDYRLVRESNALKLRPANATITISDIPAGSSITKVTVGDDEIVAGEDGSYTVAYGANVGVVYSQENGGVAIQAILGAAPGSVASAPVIVEKTVWGADDNTTYISRSPNATPLFATASVELADLVSNGTVLISGKMKGAHASALNNATIYLREAYNGGDTMKLQFLMYDGNNGQLTKGQNVTLTQVKCGDYILIVATTAKGFYINDNEDHTNAVITPNTTNYKDATAENAYEVVKISLPYIAHIGETPYCTMESAIAAAQSSETDKIVVLDTTISKDVEIPFGVTLEVTYANRVTGAISGEGFYKMINTSDMESTENWDRTIGAWFGAGALSSFNGTLWLARGRFKTGATIEEGRVTLKVTDGAQLYLTGGTISNPIEVSGSGIPTSFEDNGSSATALRLDGATCSGTITAVVENEVVPRVGTHNATNAAISGDIIAPNGVQLHATNSDGVVTISGTIKGSATDNTATCKVEKTGEGEVKIKSIARATVKITTGKLRLNEAHVGVNVDFEIASGAHLLTYGWPTFDGAWSIKTDADLTDVLENTGNNPACIRTGTFTKLGSGNITMPMYIGKADGAYTGTIIVSDGSVKFSYTPVFGTSEETQVKSGAENKVIKKTVDESAVTYALVNAAAKIGEGETARYFETVAAAIDAVVAAGDTLSSIVIIGNPTIPAGYALDSENHVVVAQASVTVYASDEDIIGTTTYYATLAEAIANGAGAYVNLESDIALDATLEVSTTMGMNLKGHTLSHNAVSEPVIRITTAGRLSIDSTGSVGIISNGAEANAMSIENNGRLQLGAVQIVGGFKTASTSAGVNGVTYIEEGFANTALDVELVFPGKTPAIFVRKSLDESLSLNIFNNWIGQITDREGYWRVLPGKTELEGNYNHYSFVDYQQMVNFGIGEAGATVTDMMNVRYITTAQGIAYFADTNSTITFKLTLADETTVPCVMIGDVEYTPDANGVYSIPIGTTGFAINITTAAAVCKIDDAKYASIKRAIAAAGSQTATIKLLKATAENVEIPENVTVEIAAVTSYTGTVSGSGTLRLVGNGMTGTSADTPTITGLTAAAWTGTVEIKDWHSERRGFIFAPNNYGHAQSSLVLNGYKGYIHYSGTHTFKNLAFEGEGALFNGSYGTGDAITFKAETITGSGTIDCQVGGGNGTMTFAGDASGFTGSITANTKYRVAFTATTDETLPAFAQKTIVVGTGANMTLTSGKTWTADGGVVVNGTLKKVGSLGTNTKFKGSGEVIYEKEGGTTQINEFTDGTTGFNESAWTGTVTFRNFPEHAKNHIGLGTFGNANSKIKLNGLSGYFNEFSNGSWGGTLVLEDYSDSKPAWKQLNGGSGQTITVDGLEGDGTWDGTGDGASQWMRFGTGENFTGTINLGTTDRSIVFGGSSDSGKNGTIIIGASKTVSVAAGNTWTAKNGFEVAGTMNVAADATLSGAVKLVAKTGTIVSANALTVECALDGYELVTTKDNDESPTTWTYTVVIEDLVNERTTPINNSASIDAISIGNNGVQKFSGSGGVQVANLQVKEGGKIVIDPIKMPVYVTGGVPAFAAGSQIALAEDYDENTKGVFTLLAWNGSEKIAEENLPTFIGHNRAQLSQETYTVRVENNVNGAEKTYTVLKVDLDPSVATKPVLTIMPVGDSITEGTSAREAYFGRPNYRSFLMKKLAAEGYDVRSTGLRKTVNMDAADVYMPEAWSWHNGVSGQRLITSPTTGARAGWEQAIETALENSDVPDVITFKIGTNDKGTDVGLLFEHWKGVMWRIIKARPATKIVVGTIMDYVGTDWEDSWNNKLREAIGYDEETGTWRNTPGFPANQVYLADLNVANPRYAADGTTFLNSFEGTGASDLHPSWLGHEKNAEEWLRVIKIALADPKVKVSDSEEDAVYTPNTTSGARNNVGADYLKGFKHVKTFKPNNTAISESASYDTEDADLDEVATDSVFARVGYYMELKGRAGNIRWVWVDVPAWDGNRSVEQLGLPVADGAAYHRKVDGVHIDTNDCGIEKVDPSDDTKSAIVRFTNKGSGYKADASIDGVGKNYGYDGVDAFNGESYGMMQLYRVAPSTGKTTQTLMAFNHWKVADQQEIGIGDFAYHGSPLSGTNYNKFSINYMYTHEFERLNLASYLAQDEAVVSIEFWAKPYEAKIGDGEAAQYFETVQSAIDSLGEDGDITTIQIIGNPTIPDAYCVVDGHLAHWGFKASNTGDSGSWTIPTVTSGDIKTSTTTKTRTKGGNDSLLTYTINAATSQDVKKLVVSTLVDLRDLPANTQNGAVLSVNYYNTTDHAANIFLTSDKKLSINYDNNGGAVKTTNTYQGLHLITVEFTPTKVVLYVDGENALESSSINCHEFKKDYKVQFGTYCTNTDWFVYTTAVFHSCDVKIVDADVSSDITEGLPTNYTTSQAAYAGLSKVEKAILAAEFINDAGEVSIPGAYSVDGGAVITNPTEIRELAQLIGTNDGSAAVNFTMPFVPAEQTTDANTVKIAINLSHTVSGNVTLCVGTSPDGANTVVDTKSNPEAGTQTFTLNSISNQMGEGKVLYFKVKAAPAN